VAKVCGAEIEPLETAAQGEYETTFSVWVCGGHTYKDSLRVRGLFPFRVSLLCLVEHCVLLLGAQKSHSFALSTQKHRLRLLISFDSFPLALLFLFTPFLSLLMQQRSVTPVPRRTMSYRKPPPAYIPSPPASPVHAYTEPIHHWPVSAL
jgi:hypothetical protein